VITCSSTPDAPKAHLIARHIPIAKNTRSDANVVDIDLLLFSTMEPAMAEMPKKVWCT
jgi:hypothetical protein